MSDDILPKQPLGVGALISETFSVFTSNFVKVLIIGFLSSAAGLIVNSLFLGFEVAIGVGEATTEDPTALVIGAIASMVLGVVIYGLVTGILVMLAYDAKLGRQNSIGTYIATAMSAIFPIIILSIVAYVLAMLGALALGIGALWVAAVFYVFVPICLIEKGGFGSLSRSADLTKEYRWPIVGLYVVMMIVMTAISLVAGLIVGVVGYTAMAGLGLIGMIIFGALYSALTGIAYAIPAIAVALTYARLREIKDGVDVDQIAAVFD